MQVLAIIGIVLGLFAVASVSAVLLSYRKFCRAEDIAFEIECAEFWRVNCGGGE